MTHDRSDFRLAVDGRHAFLDANDAFFGMGVHLLIRDAKGRWHPRPQPELERLFRIGFGERFDLGRRMTKLAAAARALNAGDRSMAAIALVQAELPPLPDHAAARRMAKADGLIKNNPDEPRDARGRWTTEGADAPSGKPQPSANLIPASGATTNVSRAISATGRPHHVEIAYADGSTEVRDGGSATWRTNNPGAIVAGKWANSHGAIGSDGHLAIFPDEATGMEAQKALLLSNYGSVTLDQMVHAWAPPDENDTAKYQRLVRLWTGLSGTEKIADLNADQLARVMEAQRRMEQWRTGAVTRTVKT
jgi:hypothetical protein